MKKYWHRFTNDPHAVAFATVLSALCALVLAFAIPSCVDDTGMYRGSKGGGYGRGGRDASQEHGDPLNGRGPKNPNGKDNRPHVWN